MLKNAFCGNSCCIAPLDAMAIKDTYDPINDCELLNVQGNQRAKTAPLILPDESKQGLGCACN